MEMLAASIGRAMRSDARSKDPNLPKIQQVFHAGQRETHLQYVAMLMGTEVKAIRPHVLGSEAMKTKTKLSIEIWE